MLRQKINSPTKIVPIIVSVLISVIETSFVITNSASASPYPGCRDLDSSQVNTPHQKDQKQGWTDWQPWDSFPHAQIQMGMSNLDYGGMMDMEYACFGSVGSENDLKKSQTYWYRISETREIIDEETFVPLEVGCWIDNQFKAIMPIKGIILDSISK
jgi:hypothetical protein